MVGKFRVALFDCHITPAAQTVSMHLGAQRDTSPPTPRVLGKDLSIYPWQTDFFFKSMRMC